jgi:hypothetical protein
MSFTLLKRTAGKTGKQLYFTADSGPKSAFGFAIPLTGEKLIAAMTQYNEELMKAGVLIDLLHQNFVKSPA